MKDCCDQCLQVEDIRMAPNGIPRSVCIKPSSCPCHQNEAGWDVFKNDKEAFEAGFADGVAHSKDEAPYHQEDHGHCWESRKPPCGQKIEHLKCCLCEVLNPKVVSRAQIAEVVDGTFKELQTIWDENEKPFNMALIRKTLEALKAKLINPNKHD